MRTVTSSAIALSIALGGIALSELACARLAFGEPAQAPLQACPRPDALGVARDVEIDTLARPHFGAHYHEQTFLADGEVVLTFDDGPLRAQSGVVLEALAAQCVHATFFIVGSMALADPQTAREYVRDGHTLAIHTWSHQNLATLSTVKGIAEIELGLSAVRLATGAPIAPFFRFPYLRDTPATIAHLDARHIAVFDIDIDSKDYATHDANVVRRKVMTELAQRRSGIILFHDIQRSTARALPLVLADLKANGYRIVHLVPKAPASTLPAFDALAQHALERRRKTASEPGVSSSPIRPRPPRKATTARGDAPSAQPSPSANAARTATDDWARTVWQ